MKQPSHMTPDQNIPFRYSVDLFFPPRILLNTFVDVYKILDRRLSNLPMKDTFSASVCGHGQDKSSSEASKEKEIRGHILVKTFARVNWRVGSKAGIEVY